MRVDYPEPRLNMVLDKARFWIRVDYPEPCLNMVLDKAGFCEWFRIRHGSGYTYFRGSPTDMRAPKPVIASRCVSMRAESSRELTPCADLQACIKAHPYFALN
ncbi:hypothetical protein Bbelb_230220 [Branchiostoma belcheri]|nr:hypothetical protein Bbelb_230220 [Branchiostoma belcheri]